MQKQPETLRSLATEESTQPSAIGSQPNQTLGDPVWLKAE
jgi:hypothetical protein